MGIFSGITNAFKGATNWIGDATKSLLPVAAPIAGAATGNPWLATLGSTVGTIAETAGKVLNSPLGQAGAEGLLSYLSTNKNNEVAADTALEQQRAAFENAKDQDRRSLKLSKNLAKYNANLNRKYQRKNTQSQFQWLRKAAEKGGFNPASVLGTGTASAPAGSVITAAPVGTFTPNKTSAGYQGLQRFADVIANYDPIAAETGRLQNELAKAQLDAVKNKKTRLGVSPVQYTHSPVETVANVISTQGGDAAEAARQQSVLSSDGYIGDPRLLRDGEPAELETDAYGAAVRNQFWPYAAQLIKGNNPMFDQFLNESVRKLPNFWESTTRIAKGVTNQVQKTRLKNVRDLAVRQRQANRTYIPAPDDRMSAKTRRTNAGGW